MMVLDTLSKLRVGVACQLGAVCFIGGIALAGGKTSTISCSTQDCAKHSPSLTGIALTISILSSAGTVGIAAAVGAVRDKSGTLQLENDSLTGQVKALQARLDREYQEKEATTQTALSAQDAITEYETKLSAAVEMIRILEPFKAQSERLSKQLDEMGKTLALQEREFNVKLSQVVTECEARESKLSQDWEDKFAKELHIESKRKVGRVRERLYANYDRNLKEHLQHSEQELASVREERDKLKTYIRQFADHDLKEVEETFKNEWAENDRLLQASIDTLRQENARLNQSDTFPGDTPSTRRGNTIIEMFWRKGVTLDGRWIERGQSEDVIYYQLRGIKPAPGFLDILNDETTLQAIALELGTLSPVKFEFEADRYLIKVKLHHSRIKVDSRDIDKLWRSKDVFLKHAANWARVRVTGGSEAGKSPTAENIAYAILRQRQDTAPGRVKLANPQHDSEKNYWTVEAVAKSHKESFDLMREQAELVEQRSQGTASRDEFILYLFDEVDTTMKVHKTASNHILNIIKQASHQNLGVILTGQNANASEYPGLDRSDFENVVNVHIGSNAYHAITNSNMSNDRKAKLTERADKVQAYCEAKNFEHGMTHRDTHAYRFALVMEPNKEPWFAELPPFGDVDLSSVSVGNRGNELGNSGNSSGNSGNSTAQNPDSAVAIGNGKSSYIGETCQKCKQGTFTRTKHAGGTLVYVCGHCKKTTSENVLNQTFSNAI